MHILSGNRGRCVDACLNWNPLVAPFLLVALFEHDLRIFLACQPYLQLNTMVHVDACRLGQRSVWDVSEPPLKGPSDRAPATAIVSSAVKSLSRCIFPRQ